MEPTSCFVALLLTFEVCKLLHTIEAQVRIILCVNLIGQFLVLVVGIKLVHPVYSVDCEDISCS